MEKINFSSNNINNPELQKRVENQQNFEAIDKEKLKQDTVELAQKAKENAQDNALSFILREYMGIDFKNPKKMLISLPLTIATVVSLAVLGNKSVGKMSNLGVSLDKVLLGDGTIGKIYKGIAGFLKKGKDSIFGFFKKSKTIDNISQTFKEKFEKPKVDLCRGYGKGFISIFSLTPVDTLQKALKGKNAQEVNDIIKKLVGDVQFKDIDISKTFKGAQIDGINLKSAQSVADYLFERLKPEQALGIKDNREFCTILSAAIRKNFKCNSNEEFLKVLEKMKKGDISPDLCNILMKDSGLGAATGSWWPVNIINKIGKALGGNKWKEMGKGNLGDSLIKFNAVNGTLADTKLGTLVQKSILVPTESVSNFVNDKSGMGFFLCGSTMALYNNVQDAPKKKRIATVADDFIGTIGAMAISTPLAFKTTYGLASLANLQKGKGLLSGPLRAIGKFFSIGLHKGKLGFLSGPIGGALRFALVMFVFSGIFAKPIRKIIHKIFGKPYNAEEEKQKAQLEAQKNTVIPELGITQGELMEKMQKNPQALQNLQHDPELVNLINQNPKLIIDLLDGKDVKKESKKALSQAKMSPLNSQIIKRNKANFNSDSSIKKTPSKDEAEKTPQRIPDSATYIPSSEYVAKNAVFSQEQNEEYNNAMAKADKVLKQAEKYI